MAFCAAKGKTGAIRTSRGFAKQKSHQFMRTFLCFVSFMRVKEMKRKSEPRCNLGEQNLGNAKASRFEQDQKVARIKGSSLQGCEQNLRRRRASGTSQMQDYKHTEV